jgi:hypothetical protein
MSEPATLAATVARLIINHLSLDGWYGIDTVSAVFDQKTRGF